jgi:hypothetical protein
MPPKYEENPDRSSFIPNEETNGDLSKGGRDDLD